MRTPGPAVRAVEPYSQAVEPPPSQARRIRPPEYEAVVLAKLVRIGEGQRDSNDHARIGPRWPSCCTSESIEVRVRESLAGLRARF